MRHCGIMRCIALHAARCKMSARSRTRQWCPVHVLWCTVHVARCVFIMRSAPAAASATRGARCRCRSIRPAHSPATRTTEYPAVLPAEHGGRDLRALLSAVERSDVHARRRVEVVPAQWSHLRRASAACRLLRALLRGYRVEPPRCIGARCNLTLHGGCMVHSGYNFRKGRLPLTADQASRTADRTCSRTRTACSRCEPHPCVHSRTPRANSSPAAAKPNGVQRESVGCAYNRSVERLCRRRRCRMRAVLPQSRQPALGCRLRAMRNRHAHEVEA